VSELQGIARFEFHEGKLEEAQMADSEVRLFTPYQSM
jgi:hypothetical protein